MKKGKERHPIQSTNNVGFFLEEMFWHSFHRVIWVSPESDGIRFGRLNKNQQKKTNFKSKAINKDTNENE
jgi:hypothetical protein